MCRYGSWGRNSLTIRHSRSDLARSAIWSIIGNPSKTSRTLGEKWLM